MSQQRKRSHAASLALGAAVALTAIKFVAGWLSGSVGVLSEAIHSLLDLISAGVAFFTIREAGKPADREHPFGHGKFETVSSLLESLLLWVAAAFIIYEGIDRFGNPKPLEMPGLAVGVIAFSLIASFYVYRHNLNAARITDSAAIHLNALHFLADVVASAAVLVGLILMYWTGWSWIDPVMAFAVAGYILLISWSQVQKAIRELVDARLPIEEVKKIESILENFSRRILGSHDLRTRKSGSSRHIDFHMLVCGRMSVSESHSICDEIEEKILEVYPGSWMNIHVEPCESETPDCHKSCSLVFKKDV